MKIIFTLTLLILISMFALNAQTVLLEEDFNSGYNYGPFPPDNWTVEEFGVIFDNNAQYPDYPKHWAPADDLQAGGEISEANLNNYPYTESGMCRLISPVLNTSGNSSLNISFKHKYTHDEYGEYTCWIGLATTTDGGTTWNEVWNTGSLEGDIGPELKSITISNADVNSPTFQFCLFFDGDFYTMSSWRIDDILLEAPAQKDILVSSILGDGQFAMSDVYVPEATVQNMGASSETFDLRCVITDFESGSELYNNIVNTTMLVGEEQNISFPNFNIPENGRVYNVEVESLLASDEVPGNNKTNKDINTWTTQKQNVLLELTTYVSCAACPTAALGATTINEDYNVSVIEHHTASDLQPYQYSTEDGRARISYYGASGAPSAWFDMHITKGGGCPSMNCIDEYLPKFNQAMAIKTPVLINMEVYETTTTNIYDVVVTVNKEEVVAKDNLRLMLTLTESHIPNNWSTVDPILTELDFVNRVMYPNVNGITIDLVNNNQIVQNYTVDASAYNYTMELVAWVEDNENRYTYQTQEFALEDAMPLSISKINKSSISVYPNPCSSTLNINNVGAENSEYQIINILGKIELVGSIIQGVNTIDVSSLSNGTYILKHSNEFIKFSVFK